MHLSNIFIKSDLERIVQGLGDITFKDKSVLVSGGAGFLGSWMCATLMEQGSRVICVDNLSSGLRENISPLLRRKGFEFMEHDISQPLRLDQRVDLVIHMASRASPFEFERFPLEILKANTLGTMVSLGVAQEHGARFLYTSTSEIYGNPAVVPTPETYNGDVNPIGVRSCYDEAKRCGEAYVMAFKQQYGLDVRIARIFNTYGPRMRADGIYGRAVPRFIEQALSREPITVFGTGEQTRSFCYVTDQVEGLLRLAFLPEASGKVVNIGSNHEVTIIDLARTVKRLTGSSSELAFHPLPQDDPQRRCPDISRARQLLGWQPKVGLEEGLNRTMQWLKERT